jgi:lipopolysaccharide/colanic/teichoic acid biosynthesis glycosyltransferase
MDRRVALGVKRGLDVVGAALGLVVLSPVMAAAAVAIRATLGAPVLFRQVRPGLGGRPFTILKFRTMRAPRPGEVWYLTNEQRLGRVGRFLRASSLDELPELWNVLRGEMSLVGPRPLLVHYLETYTPEEARRHDVRPGLTGWAAVNGRHALRFKDRLALDVWYVDHWSLALDLRILARTVLQVALRRNVTTSEDLSLGFPLPPGDPPPPSPGRSPRAVGGAEPRKRSASSPAVE